ILESYILLSRYKDAFVIAKEAAELMPKNANALTMVGVVLSHSPESYDKAVAILNTALSIDPRCTDAVAALVSLYVSNDKHDEAIALLEGTLPRNNTDAMHTRLADVLTLANQLPRAVVHYNNALTVDRMLHPEHDDGDEVEEADVGDLDEEMDEEDMALNPHEAFFEGEEQQHIEGGDSSSGSAH
ncbi:Anaphase promoting complex subunit 7, partial [Spiromyces aspiralis]